MKHPFTYTLVLVALFLLSQLLGLLVLSSYFDAEASASTGVLTYKQLPYNLERPEATPAATLVLISSAVLLGTGLLFLIIRFRKTGLWKAWYFLSVFITLSVALAAFIPSLAAAAISFAAAVFKVFRPHFIIHNLTELFLYGGLAAIFVPMLTIPFAAALLLLISAYDAFAVWKSRHMVKLAEFQTSSKVFAGFSIPYTTSAKTAPVTTTLQKEKAGPGIAILGGGDIGFPLLFSGTLLPEVGFAKTIIVVAAAAIALTTLLFLSKKGKFYPAMPFISAGCFVGYGIATLL